MARLLCRVFGHRIERYRIDGLVGGLVGAAQCTRCWARLIFRMPGLTDAQVDLVLPP